MFIGCRIKCTLGREFQPTATGGLQSGVIGRSFGISHDSMLERGRPVTSSNPATVRVQLAGVEPSGDARWSSFWSSFCLTRSRLDRHRIMRIELMNRASLRVVCWTGWKWTMLHHVNLIIMINWNGHDTRVLRPPYILSLYVALFLCSCLHIQVWRFRLYKGFIVNFGQMVWNAPNWDTGKGSYWIWWHSHHAPDRWSSHSGAIWAHIAKPLHNENWLG